MFAHSAILGMGEVDVSSDGGLRQILVNFSCFEPVTDIVPKIKTFVSYSVIPLIKFRIFPLEQWFSTCEFGG